jgi:hypothetical protein
MRASAEALARRQRRMPVREDYLLPEDEHGQPGGWAADGEPAGISEANMSEHGSIILAV